MEENGRDLEADNSVPAKSDSVPANAMATATRRVVKQRTTLDILALVFLGMIKPHRDAAVPEEFGELATDVSAIQADSTIAIQTILRKELGIDWDGQQKLSEVIVAEAKRIGAQQNVLKVLDGKIHDLAMARYALMFPNLAGKSIADEAVVVADGNEWSDKPRDKKHVH